MCRWAAQPFCTLFSSSYNNMDNNIMSTTLKMYFHIICRLWIHTHVVCITTAIWWILLQSKNFHLSSGGNLYILYSHIPVTQPCWWAVQLWSRCYYVCVSVFVYFYASNGSLFAFTRNLPFASWILFFSLKHPVHPAYWCMLSLNSSYQGHQCAGVINCLDRQPTIKLHTVDAFCWYFFTLPSLHRTF